jgi:site-specific DNA-methyltransferase (adenine-specific)
MSNQHRYKSTSTANGQGRQKHDIDDCRTPQGIFDTIDNMYHFTLDVCANKENAKCDAYYDKKKDGLKQPWDGTVWLAPPFSNRQPKLWIAKAVQEVKANSDIIVWAFVRDGGTRWVESARGYAKEYCRIVPEVKFENPRNANISHPMCLLRFGGDGPRVTSVLTKVVRKRDPHWKTATYKVEYIHKDYIVIEDPTFIY